MQLIKCGDAGVDIKRWFHAVLVSTLVFLLYHSVNDYWYVKTAEGGEAMKDTEAIIVRMLDNITESMRRKGISQLKLEQLCGIDHRQISRYLNGSTRISFIAFIRILHAIQIDITDVIPCELRVFKGDSSEDILSKINAELNEENRVKLMEYARLLQMKQRGKNSTR